ncbi:DUF1508 domain-containing protein [Flavobacterium sp. RSB2_4_14]|uniref:DUF1508 domain-containing protein n=1 Tax=Flavobacterium sp. RSB2_4_14 TaxID=3447665 RepID=UPI003F2BEDF5
MGTFVISKRVSDLYKFEFVSRKGKTIFISANYELRFECEDTIEVLKHSIDKCVFLKFKTAKGKCFFKLMMDEKVLATSRKYSTELMMQKGIEEIIKYGAKAEILDFSASNSIFSDI